MRCRFMYFGGDLCYLVLSQTSAYTARPRIRASVSRDVPVLIVPTHKGMTTADLTWVPGSAPRWFTHPDE